jgi:hypothetical protein
LFTESSDGLDAILLFGDLFPKVAPAR